MATDMASRRLSLDDFETASIHSAAPSYFSDAPSYHSTVHPAEPIPPYSPPERAPSSGSALLNGRAGAASSSSARESDASRAAGPELRDPPQQQQQGLPPVPGPRRPFNEAPSLDVFRIPSWPTMSSNPTARHYHNVASRRMSQQAVSSSMDGLRRVFLERVEEEERSRFRPLEDPYLVGEEAAARARRERLARENGDAVLIQEDRHWNAFLAQMKGWEQPRERSSLRGRDLEGPSRGSLARRMGMRF